VKWRCGPVTAGVLRCASSALDDDGDALADALLVLADAATALASPIAAPDTV
jgi:hypothetical protein